LKWKKLLFVDVFVVSVVSPIANILAGLDEEENMVDESVKADDTTKYIYEGFLEEMLPKQGVELSSTTVAFLRRSLHKYLL
jgi:hypothetical protein